MATAAKLVVVTGCDTGFGKQVAEELAALGWGVIAGCFTAEGIDTIKKAKGEVHSFKLDVTDQKSVDAFNEEVAKLCKGKGLDGLINNAGVAPTGFCEWADLSVLEKAMDINVYGQIRMTKGLLPLIRQARGRIINVSSICGRIAFGGAPWYAATKFAVEGWTDGLRREMRPFGVHVALVEPGFFKTAMVNIESYADILKNQWAALDDEKKKAYGEQTLEGYIQNVKDQCEMLSDPDTGKVTGAMITALTARFAKARYPVGGSARFLFLPISHLPTWIADGILGGMNQKYKPDGTVSQPIPRRLDLAALWTVGVPLLSYGMSTQVGYSTSAAAGISSLIAFCLSWKMS